LPKKLLDGHSPYEMLHKLMPYNKKIKQFGLKCFYLDKTYKTALESKGKEAIFCGITPNYNLYRVYDPERRAILIVREVKFMSLEPQLQSSFFKEETKQKEEKREEVNIENIFNDFENFYEEQTINSNDYQPPTNKEEINIPSSTTTTTTSLRRSERNKNKEGSDSLVGKRVKVLWPNNKYKHGTVIRKCTTQQDKTHGTHVVYYDDQKDEFFERLDGTVKFQIINDEDSTNKIKVQCVQQLQQKEQHDEEENLYNELRNKNQQILSTFKSYIEQLQEQKEFLEQLRNQQSNIKYTTEDTSKQLFKLTLAAQAKEEAIGKENQEELDLKYQNFSNQEKIKIEENLNKSTNNSSIISNTFINNSNKESINQQTHNDKSTNNEQQQ
jgi:hypothetical protein